MKTIIKHVINDLKSDIKFLKDLSQGKAKIRKIPREELKQLKPTEIFKENYIWFILLILAFLVGYNYSAHKHQDLCNEYIITNYIKPQYEQARTDYDINPGPLINLNFSGVPFANHYENATHT